MLSGRIVRLVLGWEDGEGRTLATSCSAESLARMPLWEADCWVVRCELFLRDERMGRNFIDGGEIEMLLL